MIRRILLGGLVAGLLLVTAVPALAGPPTNTTTTTHDAVETFVDVLPTCEEGAPLYTITTTSNSVEHETAFADGRVHGTFTQTGTFVAVPLAGNLPSYTGHFTAWGNFNQTNKTANSTFTFSVGGTGSDGSRLSLNQNEHFNQRPDGTAQEFFHCQ